MNQRGAVLLTAMLVLSLLSLLSINSLQTIVYAEKSNFAMNQYYLSHEVAENGAYEVLKEIVIKCKSDIATEGSIDNGNRTRYDYTIESLPAEKRYKITTTGYSLDTYKSTVEMGFYYENFEKEFNANNGWGNGDQDAPGNSLNNNNAENSVNGKQAPKGIQKKREKESKKYCDGTKLELLYWTKIL
jgi:hypothetical protein